MSAEDEILGRAFNGVNSYRHASCPNWHIKSAEDGQTWNVCISMFINSFRANELHNSKLF